MELIFWALVISTATLFSYTGKHQAATLWAGKVIADSELARETPRGFQDAITSRSQDRRNTILPALYVIILIYGFYLAWYLPIIAVPIFLLVTTVAGRMFSSDLDRYIRALIQALDNRAVDYRKINDSSRAAAADHFSEKLKDVYERIRGRGLRVPSVTQAMAMPFGTASLERLHK